MRKQILIGIAAMIGGGCVTSPQKVDQEIGGHHPQEYKHGYAAGCDSGYVAAGHVYYKFNKDAPRYAIDNLYKNGWDDGFAICKGRYESIKIR